MNDPFQTTLFLLSAQRLAERATYLHASVQDDIPGSSDFVGHKPPRFFC
jgi:hypothetical protein